MGLRDVGRRRLASQLGHPHGVFGRFVTRELNARNRQTITAVVAALELAPGAVGMDVGFGGGLGLQLLLDAVGGSGHVHGVDQSDLAVTAARRTYADAIAAGRMTVHQGLMTALPLDSGSVTGAISVNTVYFLDDEALVAAFAEFVRVLTPDGRLGLGVGDPRAMAKDPLMAHGFNVRRVAELLDAAATAGLVAAGQSRTRSGDDAPHVLMFRKA